MKVELLISLMAASAFTALSQVEYNWDCNHYETYTVDVCYQDDSNDVYYYFTCNTTDSMVQLTYTDDTCSGTVSDVTVYTADNTTSSGDFECDQDSACEYGLVYEYSDESCSGDSYTILRFIFDQCYEYTSNSFIFESCDSDNNTITVSEYSTTDCTASPDTMIEDYNQQSESQTGCWEVCNKCIFVYTFFFFFLAVIIHNGN